MGIEQTKTAKTYQEELEESNMLLLAPADLTDDERIVWNEITTLIIASTRYKKTTADVELIRQYCQTKIMRDRAWREYNKNPERYMRIENVTKEEFGFTKFYRKAPSLFNARAIEFFYEMLARYGIKEVSYYEVKDNFTKHYGYFRIAR